MKIQTGFRVATNRFNKKTGYYTSYAYATVPVSLDKMTDLDVKDLLYGFDNLTFCDNEDTKIREVVVERYIDKDELRERIVNEKDLTKILFKKFGKSAYWHQIYTRNYEKFGLSDKDTETKSIFRVWILTKSKIIRKDVISTFEEMDEISDRMLKNARRVS